MSLVSLLHLIAVFSVTARNSFFFAFPLFCFLVDSDITSPTPYFIVTGWSQKSDIDELSGVPNSKLNTRLKLFGGILAICNHPSEHTVRKTCENEICKSSVFVKVNHLGSSNFTQEWKSDFKLERHNDLTMCYDNLTILTNLNP